MRSAKKRHGRSSVEHSILPPALGEPSRYPQVLGDAKGYGQLCSSCNPAFLPFTNSSPHAHNSRNLGLLGSKYKAWFLIDFCLVVGFDANSDQSFWGPLQKGLKPENSVEPYRGRRGPAESLRHREAAAHAASGQGIHSPRADAMGRRDAAFLIRCWPPPGPPRARPSPVPSALQLLYPVVLWVKALLAKVDQGTAFSSVRRGLTRAGSARPLLPGTLSESPHAFPEVSSS